MFINSIKIFCLLLFVITNNAHSREAESCQELANASIIALIATPEKFENRCVRIRGVFRWDSRRAKIYFNKESLQHYVIANGIDVQMEPSKLNEIKHLDQSYVTVTGIFDNGTLKNLFELRQ